MKRLSFKPWQDWPLAAKSAAALMVPFALMLAALVSSFQLQRNINAAESDVRRALAIQADMQTLQALVAESAMSIRGYLLTGREDFLDPYLRAQEALPETFRSLHALVRDPEVQASLARIENLWARKKQSLESLRHQGRTQAPSELRAHLVGSKGLLDELRAELRAMYARETTLVREFSAAAAAAVRVNLWVDLVTTLLVTLSGVAAFLLLFGAVVRRVKALVDNAERLSHGEPLLPVPVTGDELGVLAQRLHNTSALLAARAEEARAASLAKTHFLSRTSHELRTPLNAIMGFAQLLRTDLADSDAAAHLDQILVASRHLLGLIDEVLDIARIESGELRLETGPLRLAPLVAECLAFVEPLAAQRGVRLGTPKVPASLLVMADHQRLRQVVLNLLSNAIKYNRPSGTVMVLAVAEEPWIRLDVIDTGVGIRPALLPRLFSPFERLDAESGPEQGTGLGLALSRQLMARMGGEIEVKSQPGVGSTFSLRLPRADDQVPIAASTPAGSAGRSEPIAVRQRRILVVEDNASNVALMKALLARRPEWVMALASDGDAALRMACAEPPDLIVLDLDLPGRSGESVLAELKRASGLADIPVVIVSADAQPATVARLRQAGADDYLTKPLQVSEFLRLLDQDVT